LLQNLMNTNNKFQGSCRTFKLVQPSALCVSPVEAPGACRVSLQPGAGSSTCAASGKQQEKQVASSW
jgi:hypothetical protein